ncbi:protein Gemin2 [Drosophila rhopaloa]|uniref:Gem-associated protein 2 n=1 Tax=Drosophila rhopaloa TaxID=1041015 RepID=A0ABM5HRR6_DRORH|nr:protein Gemin2 [Drosophila rhopaloa]
MQNEPEEQTFQLQALEIREPDVNFDPKKPPESGEEYLMHMLYERKRCPAVVTKRSSKIRDNAGNNTFEMMDNPALPPFKCLLPTPEWRDEQVKSFQAARSQVLILRRELVNHNYDQSAEPPLTSDQEKWQEFCRNQQPLLSTLLHLTQSDLEHLLEMLSKWLQVKDHDTDLLQDVWLARWLYATLVCLHLPLEPHVFSTLRYIARSSIHLRNQLKAEEVQRAAPYNLLLTLIVHVFAQSDFKEYI